MHTASYQGDLQKAGALPNYLQNLGLVGGQYFNVQVGDVSKSVKL